MLFANISYDLMNEKKVSVQKYSSYQLDLPIDNQILVLGETKNEGCLYTI